MNYYDARQRKTDKKWDYTCMNDGRIWPVGYCADAGGGHHDTAEEARECYTRYLLENRMRLDGKMDNQQLRCEICKEFTDGFAEVDHSHFTLCGEHRTREHVEKLFGTVGQITSSW